LAFLAHSQDEKSALKYICKSNFDKIHVLNIKQMLELNFKKINSLE